MMGRPLLKPVHKSYIEKGKIYFWTATINNWQRLLERDEYKDVIINSLQYLSEEGKVDVFAFVIMPTHLHFIWRIIELNGKESPQASFLKYTAHIFQKMVRKENKSLLNWYSVDASNKKYEFWRKDSLAVLINTKGMSLQILKYIHRNPLAGRWKLAKDISGYMYSSASYYELNKKTFPFLKDLYDEF